MGKKTMFKRELVIDAKNHLVGRLASSVAKELLSGQAIVIVRAEQSVLSGGYHRNKAKLDARLRLACAYNPKNGPFVFRSPEGLLYRAIRGMIPRKTKRGEAALDRLQIFSGMPCPYDKRAKSFVTDAQACSRLKSDSSRVSLGVLAASVGWNHGELVKALEAKRMTKLTSYITDKKASLKARQSAVAAANSKLSADEQAILKNFGKLSPVCQN